MDLLNFDVDALYFDQTISDEAQQNIQLAAENYSQANIQDKAQNTSAKDPEKLLLKAYFLEPEHPLVLVALYRFFYYQHRIQDALIIAERVLQLYATKLSLPQDWQQLNSKHIQSQTDTMDELRFYLFTLKGAAYLEMRLGHYEIAKQRLNKIIELDSNDRLGAKALLDVLMQQ